MQYTYGLDVLERCSHIVSGTVVGLARRAGRGERVVLELNGKDDQIVAEDGAAGHWAPGGARPPRQPQPRAPHGSRSRPSATATTTAALRPRAQARSLSHSSCGTWTRTT